MDKSELIVIAASTGGCVEPETWDVLAFARKLQALAGGRVRVWVLGDDVAASAHEIARSSGYDVTALHCPGLADYLCEAYRSILTPMIREASPAYVLTAHTSRGWEWVPGIAAGSDVGCICGVDGVGSEKGRIWFAKDRYGGKVKGRYVSGAATTVLTVQPGHFTFAARRGSRPAGSVTRKTVAWQPGSTRFTGTGPAAPGSSNLIDANIIVAAGNGIGDAENLKWIDRLANLLPKSAVAGTRIVCDRGWLGYDRQVGATGMVVAPALYIACGISGASQHLAGMRGSGCVIAINTDPHAPICAEADYCVVADLTEFIPMVLATLEPGQRAPVHPAASGQVDKRQGETS